jgi:succinyl-diaminopimelate desuccinylase
MSEALELALELIGRESVTPRDGGCQQLLAERLAPLGFRAEHLRFGDVDNLYARRGNEGPLLVFLGHTDVVPTGPRAQWSLDPFKPEVRDGVLYGRGAADMKGSIASAVIALEQFVAAHPNHAGSIALLLTSDEEGPALHGVRKVIETLEARREKISWCVVGEPSSKATLGDQIRIGRRGSLHAHITIRGKQGHTAYPEKALNPIHAAAPALTEFCALRWDGGNAHFGPSTMQISNIAAGTGATNVIPGALEFRVNWRYGTASTTASIVERTEALFQRHGLDAVFAWEVGGEPFLTAQGALVEATQVVLKEQLGITPDANTGGGTSDGRFVAPTGAQVVELGPINASIHQIDEHVRVAELDALVGIYRALFERLLLPESSAPRA